MKLLESRYVLGVLLILAGILFLIGNLQIVKIGDLFWAVIFCLAGVFLGAIFARNRQQWWALVPSFALLGIGATIALSFFDPPVGEVWGGSIILSMIGLSFLVVYFFQRQHWWALIPAGVMITLAIVASVDSSHISGGIFFLGLGLTFVLLALVPTPTGNMHWALVPALVLVIMGLLSLAAVENLINYIWPATLMLIGGFLLWRVFRPR